MFNMCLREKVLVTIILALIVLLGRAWLWEWYMGYLLEEKGVRISANYQSNSWEVVFTERHRCPPPIETAAPTPKNKSWLRDDASTPFEIPPFITDKDRLPTDEEVEKLIIAVVEARRRKPHFLSDTNILVFQDPNSTPLQWGLTLNEIIKDKWYGESRTRNYNFMISKLITEFPE